MKSQSYYSMSRSEMVQFLPSHYSKVLEVGCGEGDFRLNLDIPCEYWGIEVCSNAAALAYQKMNYVLNGAYEDVHKQLR